MAIVSSDEEKNPERKPGGLSNGTKHGLQGAQIRIKDEITQVAQEGKDLLAHFQGRGPGAMAGFGVLTFRGKKRQQ